MTPAWSFHTDAIMDWVASEQLFTSEECAKIIAHCSSLDMIDAKGGNLDNIRDSRIVFVNPDGLDWVYSKITNTVKDLNGQYFKFDLWGFQEGMQFTEYNAPAGRYETHVDRGFGIACRKLSTVLLLSDPDKYTGGELQLVLAGDGHPTSLTRKQGSLIIFPSFVPHRVTPVTEGQRHTLVGWVTGRPFK